MKRAAVSVFAILFSSAVLAQPVAPLCVIDPEAMPSTWRPAAENASDFDPAPWSPVEAADALASLEGGVEEMLAYFDENEDAVPDIWEDAVGALIEVSYSSANTPALDASVRDGARQNLNALIEPYRLKDPETTDCSEVEEVMPLALYASKFYAPGEKRIDLMVNTTNAAIEDCGSLKGLFGFAFPAALTEPSIDDGVVFDLVIWSLLFIEGELVPGLELTDEMRAFSPTLWEFLQTYPIRDAWTYEDGSEDEVFVESAYLATHIAYIPTGNHRHPLYIADSPALYRFHRENFYPVLDMGELDLVAEFVDTLRQYGCTPENDIQVRDGTRFLLDIWHDGDESWMAYREPGESDSEVEPYDFIHKAWTGVLGVRERNIEPAVDGTYGGVVREWLPAPA